ncbi:hypothetical protein DAEQUDRAFT_284874 [Daedalea quercina L-15889]|uniref:Uncharacterized protein n=1 Tax=Daedalea quercina L-15889 TaxID=1314783 RepID=A0A165TVC8_9APHY|nr:hypothetical protein DAEQUDRAFT_284874 [Daedalea quercina L-15889]
MSVSSYGLQWETMTAEYMSDQTKHWSQTRGSQPQRLVLREPRMSESILNADGSYTAFTLLAWKWMPIVPPRSSLMCLYSYRNVGLPERVADTNEYLRLTGWYS